MENDIQNKIKTISSELSRINGFYQRWAQKNDINYYLLQTLHALYVNSNIMQKQISESYQMPKQTVSNVIRSLQEQGYVVLITDENDKRSKKIVFTAAGEEYAKKILSPIMELDKRILQRIGMEQYTQLIVALNIYGNAVEQEIDL